MLKLHRYERCLILSFPSIGKYKIEILYLPSGYQIAPHTHDQQDIKLVVLFAHNVRFFRQRPTEGLITFLAQWRHIFKVFTIRANDIHFFTVSKFPLIFLNFERWHSKPSSAAINLKLTKETYNYGRTTTNK